MSSDDGPIYTLHPNAPKKRPPRRGATEEETISTEEGPVHGVSEPAPTSIAADGDVDPLDEEIDASRWDKESRRGSLQRTVISASGKAMRDTRRAVQRTTKLLYRSLQREIPSFFDAEDAYGNDEFDDILDAPHNYALERRAAFLKRPLTYVPGWSASAPLPGGREVTFRPLIATDREQLVEGFERLSSESRYQRFMTAMETLPEAYVRYLTEIDQVHHFAVVAYTWDPARFEEHGLGVARFIELPDVEDEAELAITITDEAQGLGLGIAFMKILIAAAAERGFLALRAEVLPGNIGMQKLAQRFQGERIAADDGVVTWRVPVVSDNEPLELLAADNA